MRRFWPLAALVCLALGVALGVAAVFVQGPLPGDLAVTRTLQEQVTGERWAAALTMTAKHPRVWGTLALAGGLAWYLGRWPGLVLLLGSFALLKGLDALLRVLLHTPKPLAELVQVAQVSSSSGFPSSFVFVYGACFGAVLALALGAAGWRRLVFIVLAVGCLIVGALARIVLGGHWPSQALASLAVALGLVFALQWLLCRRGGAPG